MRKNFPRCRFSVKVLVLLAALSVAAAAGQDPVWEISQSLSNPESAVYDPASGFLFISNVAGSAEGKDGKGWILKATPEGKVLTGKWVDGLNAPKGMAVSKGRLYVADIDTLLTISIEEGKVTRRTKVKGAVMLNDVAVGPDGELYVSDTLGSRIYRISDKGRVKEFKGGDILESPNGLKVRRSRLYVATWGLTTDWSTKAPGRLISIGLRKKKMSSISLPLGNLDGLEPYGDGWLVSDWVAGKVFALTRTGEATVILDGFGGSADIGYIAERNLLIVPRMKEDLVSAYEIDAPIRDKEW